MVAHDPVRLWRNLDPSWASRWSRCGDATSGSCHHWPPWVCPIPCSRILVYSSPSIYCASLPALPSSATIAASPPLEAYTSVLASPAQAETGSTNDRRVMSAARHRPAPPGISRPKAASRRGAPINVQNTRKPSTTPSPSDPFSPALTLPSPQASSRGSSRRNGTAPQSQAVSIPAPAPSKIKVLIGIWPFMVCPLPSLDFIFLPSYLGVNPCLPAALLRQPRPLPV